VTVQVDRKNYFEILKIPFDPPDPPAAIKRRLAQWKHEKEEQRNNSGDQSEINKLLSMYADMENTLLTPALRQKEAAQLKEERTEQLDRLIRIMLSGSAPGITPEVTAAQLRNVGNHLGLQYDTVKKIYEEKGYHIQTPCTAVKINDYFLQQTIYSSICDHIEKLRNTDTPKYPWTKDVYDLFDFLCFFDGKTAAEKPLYKRKITDELCTIARKYSIEIATDTSSLGHILGQLFSKATTQVFNNEKNRKKYENSLKKAEHEDFFALLRTAPDVFKKDPYFAESCIEYIQTIFPDRELALAIYNSETKMLKDPYEPMEAFVYVTCPACKTMAKFRSRQEAEQAKCTVCGTSLYVTCPDPACRRKVPATAEKCVCGFSLSEFHLYYDYCRLAKQAIKDMDLAEAQRQFENAKRSNPFDPGLKELENRIMQERRQYERPVSELQSLIDRQFFMQAKLRLESILSQNPRLNLTRQKTLIESKLSEAERNMPSPGLDKQEQANRCMRILDQVRDYAPAKELLRSIPPRPPVKLSAVLKNDTVRTICGLSWQSPGDIGISYKVVRKEGGMPTGPDDGIELAGNLTDMRYEDRTVMPGLFYGYCVFSVRDGVYSPAAECRLETIMDLDKRFLDIEAKNGKCIFRWTLPQNCTGVRVLRTKGGTPSAVPDEKSRVVCERGQKGFEDTGLINHNAYTYRLQCIYKIGGLMRYSGGILTDPIIPEEPPCALGNISAKFKDKIVSVSWDESERKTDCIYIRRIRDGFDRTVIGTVMPSRDINAMLDVKVLASAYSSSCKCSFPIKYGETVRAAVVSESGSNSIISDVIQIAGVQPCEIDKNAVTVEDSNLKVSLRELPDDLVKIHYMLNEKGEAPVWGTQDDVDAGRSRWISADEYRRNGNRIIITRIPEKELCFTVIGEYEMKDGLKAFAVPSNMRINNKPKTEIRYKILWNRSFLNMVNIKKAEDPVLVIECEDESLPDMYLTCLESGKLPWSLEDEGIRILYTFPERSIEDHTVNIPLTEFDGKGLEKGTIIRLMISGEDMQEYYTVPLDVNRLKAP